MSRRKNRRRDRSEAEKKVEQRSVNEDNTILESNSNKQSPSDVNTTVDTLMQADPADLLPFPKHQSRDIVPTTATVSCQNALLEVESAAKFPSTKPMDLDLNPIGNQLENNVAGKNKRKKKKKKVEQQSVNEDNTILETYSNKQSPSGVNTTVATLMQADSADLLPFPEHQSRDIVPTTAAVSCQNALLEVESAAKFPSTNPMDLDLNPIENHLENNVAGKKKRKMKKNKKNCTAAMTNLQVTFPNAESAVQLPTQEPLQVAFPNAESTVQLPAQELQGLDMNLADNLEVKSGNRKQKKRKQKNLNKSTSNVLDVDSTAKQLAPKYQERDINLQVTLPNAESSVQLPAQEPLQVTFPNAESAVQLPAQELQGLDMNLANNLEVKSGNRKQKKRKKKNLNKPTSNVLDVDSTAKLLAPKNQESDINMTEIEKKSESGEKPASNVLVVDSTAKLLVPKNQESDINMTEIEKKSESGEKSASGKKKRWKKKKLNKPASNVIDVESTAKVLAPVHHKRDISSLSNLELKIANGLKRKRGENIEPTSDDQHVELTEQLLPPDNQEKKKKKKIRKVKKATDNNIDNVKTATQDSLSFAREETEVLGAGSVKLCPEDVNVVSVQTELTPTVKATTTTCESYENGSYLAFPEKNSVESCSVGTHLPSSAFAREETEVLGAGAVKLCPEDVNVVSIQTELTPTVKATTTTCENYESGSYLALPEKNSVESCSVGTHLPSSAEVTMHHGTPLRRKLLILDLNGLLADIVLPHPKDCKADTGISGRAIFKRPFCDDFLKFCFERFHVAIWSSRSKRIIVRVVDYLLGDLKHKLLFCWDMSHCTMTRYKTLEIKHKPLVCKDLRKIWEKHWDKGDFDESNTLLLDDSPYKALLNPVHTTIFPDSFNYRLKDDNSLGPGGDLRMYLENLAEAEHVQKYVEEHPFGQPAISENSANWGFYSEVIKSICERANCGDSV
ncbi:PREDICTED: uncharacterized protein LOC109180573 isoform X2 [Ipomoea nil]|uniref:uncharacterized protein LOC109180573 isoform X2 n=1 Tax=Ipomoea nil TaxID=35883 RepID=UPI0009011160|nr:PREDICTED: uncharacterized protein LOC109180573 isoform X2 [Ipomoea nil]